MTTRDPKKILVYPEIQRFAEHVARRETNSPNTAEDKLTKHRLILEYLRDKMELKNLSDIHPEHILVAYETVRSERNWGWNMCRLASINLRNFFDWVVKEGIAPKGFVFPELQLPQKIETIPAVMEPDVLFAIRQMSDISLQAAVLTEIAVSSGVRPDELLSLVSRQIDFSKHPVDLSTGKPSAYTGGMITIDPRIQRVKTGRPRVTFMSKIAGRMLLRYMDIMGIKQGTDIPLFSYGAAMLSQYTQRYAEAMPQLRGSEKETRPLGKRHSENDIEELIKDLPESQKKAYRRKFSNKRFDFVDVEKDKVSTSLKVQFHWHSFRHTFTCYQYYRNYYGRQHDISSLRAMLGHEAQTVTYVYLTQVAVIRDEEQWKRIHLGRATDWSRIKYAKDML